ncbi:hypothetical protein [Sphingomonas sp. AX6]|uniref:hypothetical protein n=1 Tax=Sphingomonas sp. AX6 TaxID=2653171 RepID=UPI00135A6233|nr:hypothetical protein [Sphingomonas sp. AX6]
MRISDTAFVLAAALLVAGCGEQSGDLAVEAEAITCAVGQGAAMADGCSVERTATADGTLLTIRQPDGGFHRLRLAADGRTVTTADGADMAQVTPAGDGLIDVTVGEARYRLSTVAPQPTP